MTTRIPAVRPIEVVVNSPGPWSTVRVEQPYCAMQRQGWDVRFVATPFDPQTQIRPGALVVWQRPLPVSVAAWRKTIDQLRGLNCLVLVEWDDHPDLFPPSILAKCRAVDFIHLRYVHGLQTSNSRLAEKLRIWHPHVFVLENAIDSVPPLRSDLHTDQSRLFLGNFNRECEQRQLAKTLANWLNEPNGPVLVTVGKSGLEGIISTNRIEAHQPLPYSVYRKLLSSCQVALLPLQLGEPQACKTPIKWIEAAAESVAVIGGPELYAPWFENGRFGLWAKTLDSIVPLARTLLSHPEKRLAMIHRAHERAYEFQLEKILPWRFSLYQHLFRMQGILDRSLSERFPEAFV